MSWIQRRIAMKPFYMNSNSCFSSLFVVKCSFIKCFCTPNVLCIHRDSLNSSVSAKSTALSLKLNSKLYFIGSKTTLCMVANIKSYQ